MFGLRTLLVIAIAAVGGLLAVQGNFERMYVGETDMLVLPKDFSILRDSERVIADAQKIPRALKFYDVLLKKNANLEDRFVGRSDAERKAGWNARLSVERKGMSGILVVRVFDPDQAQAKALSRMTAEDIAIVMGRYYDTEHDLDVHIVDETVVASAGRIFGFDDVTVAGSILIFIGVIILVLSGSGATPVTSGTMLLRANRALSATEKASGNGERKHEAKTVIPATEEEIRNKLNMLLEGKV